MVASIDLVWLILRCVSEILRSVMVASIELVDNNDAADASKIDTEATCSVVLKSGRAYEKKKVY